VSEVECELQLTGTLERCPFGNVARSCGAPSSAPRRLPKKWARASKSTSYARRSDGLADRAAGPFRHSGAARCGYEAQRTAA
jgi:hypothetical protein